MRILRALLIAFITTVIWGVFLLSQGTSQSCFTSDHDVGSGAVAMLVALVAQVAIELLVWSRDSGRRAQLGTIPYLMIGAVELMTLMLVGLLVVGFFDSAASCSA
jgi:hypothetical protein